MKNYHTLHSYVVKLHLGKWCIQRRTWSLRDRTYHYSGAYPIPAWMEPLELLKS